MILLLVIKKMKWKIVCLMACTLVIVGMCQNVMADFSLVDETSGFNDNPFCEDYPELIEGEISPGQTSEIPSGNPSELPPTVDPGQLTATEGVNDPNPSQTIPKLPSGNPGELPPTVDPGQLTPTLPPPVDGELPPPDGDNDPNSPEDTQEVTNHEFDIKLPIVGSLGFIFGCLVVAVLMMQKRRK
jgi:hypothetical protein